MSTTDAIAQYTYAQKEGLKYEKAAEAAGKSPYLEVLDDLLAQKGEAGRERLGYMNIPAELLVGTKTEGRSNALAGNFMPLMKKDSEFAAKWIYLCEAHMSAEGIRDPLKCYEYMGKFYVEEGNKRASVLLSYRARTLPAYVTRILPEKDGSPEVDAYYEFLDFYKVSRIYDVHFTRPGCYTKLLAHLGQNAGTEWSEDYRKAFVARWLKFGEAFAKTGADVTSVTHADAFLTWTELYPMEQIAEFSVQDLTQSISRLLGDTIAEVQGESIRLATQPDVAAGEKVDKGLLSKLMSFGSSHPDKLRMAFIYGIPLETSAWSRAHEHGREELEARMGDHVITSVYQAFDGDYYGAMQSAKENGTDVIVATLPNMIDASRRIAAENDNIRVLNCGLALPYPGLRMFYGRIHECKFITGAIAGAMSDSNTIGYIANYPIFGSIAEVNAFAAGVKMTNPRAVIDLRWSCEDENALEQLLEKGVEVISNRVATNTKNPHWAMEWGTYITPHDGGAVVPLAVPCWNWGNFYCQIAEKVLAGVKDTASEGGKAVNYWWGLDSGIIDIQLSDEIPAGVKMLAEGLKRAIISGSLDPFGMRLADTLGNLRNDGTQHFTPEELMNMDWLCDNIKGGIPSYEKLLPEARELVRLMGIYRDELAPSMGEEKPS